MSKFAATCVSPDPSFQRLFTCLEQIRSKLENKQDDLLFFLKYFRQPEFQTTVLQVQGSVLSGGQTETVGSSGVLLSQQVCDALVFYSDTNEEARELQDILSTPHVKGLLQAHDGVAEGGLLDNNEDYMIVDDGGFPLRQGVPPDQEKHSDRERRFPDKEEKSWTQTDVQKLEDWDSQTQINHWGFPEHEDTQTVCNDEQFCDEEGVLPVPLKEPLDQLEGVLPVPLKEPLDQLEGVLPVPLKEPLDQLEEVLPVPLKEPLDQEEVAGQMREVLLTDATASYSHIEVVHRKSLNSKKIVDHGHSAIKVLKLRKTDSQPLGLTVKSDEESDAIVVARILHGGTADKNGSLKVGDKIMEINEKKVMGLSTDQVADIIDGISGSVSLKVASAAELSPQIKYEVNKVYLRALFDFNPMRDNLIPCKEAGVSFKKGEILQVVSQDDLNWWQAKRADDPDDEVGLIPSKEFQETRQEFDGYDRNNDTVADEVKLISPYAKWKQRKSASKKGIKSSSKNAKGETLTYEEVAPHQASQNKKRLVLVVGPSGVGRTELKKMLLMNEPEAFVATVPHTSRPIQPYETDGKDYHFVSRHTMEKFIQDNKFIEVGEYKGCLYGTSKDSIKRAMKTGKICVIKVHEGVLPSLRTDDFMPFCVFVKPPSLGRLRSTRLVATKSTANRRGERSFKEEDLEKVINAAEVMERDYGHMFDLTVVNDNLQEAYEFLLAALNRVCNEQQWVPVSWLHSQ